MMQEKIPTEISRREMLGMALVAPLPAETRLYGEGFQMLSQTGGSLGKTADLGNYTDAKHYKMPVPSDAKNLYGMMTLALPDGNNHLLAFTSCRRFAGQFYLRDSSLQIVVDTEGLELKAGESWQLEEFSFSSGANREQLLAELAARLTGNHPPLRAK